MLQALAQDPVWRGLTAEEKVALQVGSSVPTHALPCAGLACLLADGWLWFGGQGAPNVPYTWRGGFLWLLWRSAAPACPTTAPTA